jgi:anti-sigma B factor antagonist
MSNECNTEGDGDFIVVRVTGEVDLSWSQSIRKAILDALVKAQAVGVDLSAVSYIDSSGIAALVEGFQSARGKGQKFSLIAASQSVRSVLQLARLDRVFPMVDSVDAARA